MKTVAQILQTKGSEVWSVESSATVFIALELMAEQNVGAVLVTENGRPVGILSERDYARKVVLAGRVSRDMAASEIMTPKPVCVRPDQTAEECMALMTDKRIRHLPVLEGETIVGLISIGDVVKSMLSEREFQIQQLENYIAGS